MLIEAALSFPGDLCCFAGWLRGVSHPGRRSRKEAIQQVFE